MLFYFTLNNQTGNLKDSLSNTEWNMNGECISSNCAGTNLEAVQSYQEFWHSWRFFHPGTTKYLTQKEK